MDLCQVNSDWFFNLFFPEWQDVGSFDSISSYSKRRFDGTVATFLQLCLLKFAVACYTVTYCKDTVQFKIVVFIMSFIFGYAGMEGNIKSQKGLEIE